MERRKRFFRRKRGIASSAFSWLLIFAMVISNVSTSPGLLLTAWAAESEAETEATASGEIREDGGSGDAAQTGEDSGTEETAQTGEDSGADGTAGADEDDTEGGTAGSSEGSTEESVVGDGEGSTAEGDAETEETGTAAEEETAGTEEDGTLDGAGEDAADGDAVEDEVSDIVNDGEAETRKIKVHFKNVWNWEKVYLYCWDNADTSTNTGWTSNELTLDENGIGTGEIDITALGAGLNFILHNGKNEGQGQEKTADSPVLAVPSAGETYEYWLWVSDGIKSTGSDQVERHVIQASLTDLTGPTIDSDKLEVTFSYKNPSATSVQVKGTMDNWKEYNMEKDENGLFTYTTKYVADGFAYKFVVDGTEIFDPSNPNVYDNCSFVGKASENVKINLHFLDKLSWGKAYLHYWGKGIDGTQWESSIELKADENGVFGTENPIELDGLLSGFNFIIHNNDGNQTTDGFITKAELKDNGTYDYWIQLSDKYKDSKTQYIPIVSLNNPATVKSPEVTSEGVTFRYVNPHAKSVRVASDANGWASTGEDNLMRPDGTTGVLAYTANTWDVGKHDYKFVVEYEDGTTSWILDPHNPEIVQDTDGGYNSSFYLADYNQYTKFTMYYYNPAIVNPTPGKSDVFIWPIGVKDVDGAVQAFETAEADEANSNVMWLKTTISLPYSTIGIIGKPIAGSANWDGQDVDRVLQLDKINKENPAVWYIHGKGIYTEKPNLGSVESVTASLQKQEMDYTQNNVLTLTLNGGSGNVLIDRAYVDASQLGISETLAIDPALLEVALSVTEDTEPGTYTLPITVVDYSKKTTKASVTVTVKEKEEKAEDFDWDEAVIYFMVTDRFFDGNSTNNNANGANTAGENAGLYHGGDFKGLTEKLDYLQDLGVNTIWITPIVENIAGVDVKNDDGTVNTNVPYYAAYHGYWASDFTKLNPALGTDKEFEDLIAAAHAKNMKIMVDVVLNHAGYGMEETEEGTTNTFTGMLREDLHESDKYPFYGGSQAGLPDFLTEYPEVRQQLIDWQVAWAAKGVDYFRVDTVKHVDNTTWAAFKNALTKQNPQFKMIGEYFDAGYASNNGGTLGSGQMDSLLDFNFNDWANSFVKGGISYVEGELTKRNAALNNTYLTGQFLSSHDENGFKYNLMYYTENGTVKPTGVSEADATAAALVAATLQITAKGQPVIYYGEEIGLTGANNYPYQDNRYQFDWSKTTDDNSTYVHYKKMLNIRKDYSEIFARGDRKVVAQSDAEGYDVISRSYNGETIYVGMNIKNTAKELEIPVNSKGITQYTDQYSGTAYAVTDGKVKVTIPAAANGGTVVLVSSSYTNGLMAPELTTIAKGREYSLPSRLTYVTDDGIKSLVDVTYSVSPSENVTLDGTKIKVEDAFSGTEIKLTATAAIGQETASVDFQVKVVEDKNKITLKLHYNRTDNDYTEWNAWIWPEGKGGKQCDFADEDGEKVVTYECEGRAVSDLGFRIRKGDWKEDDIKDDRYIDLSNILSGTVHYYVKSGVFAGEMVLGDDVLFGSKIKTATYNRDSNYIKVVMAGDSVTGSKDDLFTVKDSAGTEIVIASVTQKNNEYTLHLKEDLSSIDAMAKSHFVSFEGYDYKVVKPSVYSTDEFESKFTYTGNDLGATWTKEKTTFKVWAPTASKVEVKLYESGTEGTNDCIETLDMTEGENGVWSVEKAGDLNGTYYTYQVTVDGEIHEACDPYAKTTGVNGNRSMVIDMDSTNPEGWETDRGPNAGMSYTDSVIYELHVRDFSISESSGIENKGKFLGLTETGTTSTTTGQTTGLDYLTDLGVTHIHLLPSYDYATVDETKLNVPQYNWGYDPKNYNVPEGSYSTDPYNGEVRVKEMKEMIKALHDNNINVIMDVVYNHVYNADEFCFNQIVPQYFSRLKADGSYSSVSGCGNDTASERAMVKKYIVDSVNYWADEYHIDGFRFDLVGLLDTETINEVVNTVHKEHPDAVFYGEGWDMDSTAVSKPGYSLTKQGNASQVPGFAFFSDTIRDLLKGANNETDWGFVSGLTGQEEPMANCFRSIAWWSSTPTQIVNYASCHDNYTLKDKLNVSKKDATEADRVKMNNLAAAIYMTAEGIPLIHAGEEILRTKVDEKGNVIHNSYNSSDFVNRIRWENLDQKRYRDVKDYYKGLIEFRKNHAALRLTTAEQVKANVQYKWVTNEVIMFVINGKEQIPDEVSDGIVIIFNATNSKQDIDLYDAAKNYGIAEGTWQVCINDKEAGAKALSTVTDGKVTVAPISALVLVKGETRDFDSVYEQNAQKNESFQMKQLKAMIAEYEGLNEKKYTADSWKGLADALTAAKPVAENAAATLEEINKAIKDLQTAYDALVSLNLVDKDDLEELIKEFEGAGLEESDYTAESWSVFAQALANAKAILDKADATQDEVDNVYDALVDAKDVLKLKQETEAKTELNNLIEEYDKLEEGNFTPNSWKVFSNALEEAKKVSENPSATQADIEKAVADLKAAYGQLTGSANKSRLDDLVNKMAPEYKDSTIYTEDSWNALQWMLDKAKEVLNNPNATQEEVDKAADNLYEAIMGLEYSGLRVEWPQNPGFTKGDDGKQHITYTGKAIKPVIEVYDGETKLTEKTEYTVTYKSNTNAGEAVITVKGKGNYAETLTETFIIDRMDIGDLEIADLYAAVAASNTKQVALKPVVKYNGKALKLKKEYTVAYENPEKDGISIDEYNVIIKAVDNDLTNKNYTGEQKIKMTLVDKDSVVLMSKATISKIKSQPYAWDPELQHGKVQKPEVTVKATVKGSKKELVQKDENQPNQEWDYEVLYDERNTEAGETATITVRGNGTTVVGEKTVSFKITGKALKAKQVTLLGVPAGGYVYNGMEQKPEVSVRFDDEQDYVRYSVDSYDATNAGTVTVVVRGINGYTGTVKKTYKITPYNIANDRENNSFTYGEGNVITATVPYAKGGSKLTDEEVKARFTYMEGNTEHTANLELNKDYTLSYKGNKQVGDTAKVTIKGKGNFKGTITNVPFTITKQDLKNLAANATAGDIILKNAAKYDKVIPVIKDLDGKALKNRTDFTIDKETAYTDANGSPIAAESLKVDSTINVTAVATEKNYTGKVTAQFRVVADDKNIASYKVSAAAQEYAGKGIAVTLDGKNAFTFKQKVKGKWVKVALTEGEDFEIVEGSYVKNDKKGTAKVTIHGIGDYGGTKTVSFKITAKPMNNK